MEEPSARRRRRRTTDKSKHRKERHNVGTDPVNCSFEPADVNYFCSISRSSAYAIYLVPDIYERATWCQNTLAHCPLPPTQLSEMPEISQEKRCR